MKRRARLLAGVAALVVAAGACAEGYPAKPVRVIVPFPAGGAVDVVTRAVTDRLASSWSQPVIVEPKPGASGNIGARLARGAPPDGYTFMMGAVFIAVNPALDANSKFAADDFIGAALVGVAPNFFVVPAALPVSSLAEFVEYARARPGQLNAAHPGIGSFAHLCTLVFAGHAGIDLATIPYAAQPQALPDLSSGQVSFMVLSSLFAIPHARSGRIRALAVNAPTRLKQMPDVPTVVEAGFPREMLADQWFGFVAPAGTPREIINRFNAEVGKALKSPQVIDRLDNAGVLITAASPEEYDALIRSETHRWSRVIRERNLKSE